MLASHIFNLCKSSQEIGATTIIFPPTHPPTASPTDCTDTKKNMNVMISTHYRSEFFLAKRKFDGIIHVQPSVFRINSFSQRISLKLNQALTLPDGNLNPKGTQHASQTGCSFFCCVPEFKIAGQRISSANNM